MLLQSKYIHVNHSKPCPTACLPPGVCGEVAQGESQLPKTAQLASGGTAELSEDREVVACPHPNFLPFQPRLPPPFFLPKGLQQYGDFSDSLEEPVLGQREATRWLGYPDILQGLKSRASDLLCPLAQHQGACCSTLTAPLPLPPQLLP